MDVLKIGGCPGIWGRVTAGGARTRVGLSINTQLLRRRNALPANHGESRIDVVRIEDDPFLSDARSTRVLIGVVLG